LMKVPFALSRSIKYGLTTSVREDPPPKRSVLDRHHELAIGLGHLHLTELDGGVLLGARRMVSWDINHLFQ